MDDEARLEELLQANFQEDIMNRQNQGAGYADIQQMPQESMPRQNQVSQQSNEDKVRQDHPFLSFFADNFPELMEKLGRPLSQETKDLSRYAKSGVEFAEDWLHLPEVGAGILQGLTDVPVSVANTVLRPAGAPIPHADFRSMLKKPESLGGDIAHGLGNIVGATPGVGALYGAADKLPRGAGFAGNATDALKGALTGYVGGEHGDEGEGRVISAVAGAPLAVAANLTNSSIGKNVGRAYKEVKQKFNKEYDKVWQAAAKEGLDKFSGLTKNSALALKGIDKKFVEPLKDALKSRQLSDLHKGRSKLLEYVRQQDKIVKNGGAIDAKAYARAEKMAERAEKAIENTLGKSTKGVDKLYNKTQQAYKKEVVPYSNNPAVRSHAGGDLTDSDFAKLLKGNSKSGKLFRKNLAGDHPDVATNKALVDALKAASPGKILKTAVALGLGTAGYHGIKDQFLDQ